MFSSKSQAKPSFATATGRGSFPKYTTQLYCIISYHIISYHIHFILVFELYTSQNYPIISHSIWDLMHCLAIFEIRSVGNFVLLIHQPLTTLTSQPSPFHHLGLVGLANHLEDHPS